MALPVGTICEILPAYNSDTGERDNWDEIAGCECEVLETRPNGDVRVRVKNRGEEFVYCARLRPRGEH